MKASIIIPAYNESENILKVLKRIPSHYEIIIVDDGSDDNTHNIVKSAGYKCIRLKKNMGKGYACKTGARFASTGILVFIDADHQFNPKEIPKMIEKLNSYDLILGVRNIKDIPFARRMSNRFSMRIMKRIVKREFSDVLCGFRAIKKSSFAELGLDKDRYEFESEMLIKAVKKGLKIGEVNITVKYEKGKGMGIIESFKLLKYLIKNSFSR